MAAQRQNPEVVCTELEDGAVLLNMETRTYYSLNEAGVAIWQLINTTDSAAALARALATRFDVEAAQAEPLVCDFLKRLEAEHLVKPHAQTLTGETVADADVSANKKPWVAPDLIKHDEPLHEVPLTPFDPQLPLAE